MANKTVTVLTIHGRRQNVKVEPNITILDILEQVCQKFNFNSIEYDLKHHNKVMDLSAMFRFSGLPNNALLEMVPVTKVRTEADIILVVQLEDGTRLDGTFKSSTSLLDVLKTVCYEKANAEANPVMIYMRREVLWDSLDKTTLKSLGLTGGRAIIRLLQRKPEELKTQANVSAPLPHKEKPEESDDPAPEKITSTPPKDAETETPMQTNSAPENEQNSQVLAKKAKAGESSPESGPSKASSKLPSEMPAKAEIPESGNEPKPEPIINILGERDAVLFHLKTAERGSFDLPDSFFDVTVKDVRKMYVELRNKVKELEEAPLMTSELRKLEDDKRVLNSLARYKNTIIRVQFPDRHILQGIFKLHETVADVLGFVDTYLEDRTTPLHLYTTPPKTILSPESSLVEAKCAPQAILHLGFEGDSKMDKILKLNLYERLSNATGATELAARSRKYLNETTTASSSSTTCMDTDSDACLPVDVNDANVASSSANRMPNANFRPSSVQSTASDVKMPKWFKPVAK
ncbi:tether containing UBX domain for GLUT4 [Ochlerotatus camptorhynchus]|uniref:tether containing UBX domain for GLUT4 n=1 Tax=Ochlerotatus camptorhynchus TaxID=644619 RepID=UPI0031D20CEE